MSRIYPAALRDTLQRSLPRINDIWQPIVRVTPRDSDGRQCAAWAADHYLIAAYYNEMSHQHLGPLEEALKAWPGVYLTTQLWGDSRSGSRSVTVINPAWSADYPALRGGAHLRPQVWALFT